MKKYIKNSLVAVFALAMLSAMPTIVGAATVTWNNFSNDCHNTVIVSNHTTQENAGSKCWGTSVTAKAGEIVNVGVSYHNTSAADAVNTISQINLPSGAQNAFTFNGFIASGSTQATGSAVVNFTDGSTHTLTLIGANVQPDNGIAATTLPATNVQNLGTIASASSCASIGKDSYCHAGLVTYVFQVGPSSGTGGTGTTGTGTACTISSFSASPISITAGSTSTLSWNTTGCTSVSITGGQISNNYPVSGTKVTNTLQSTTTFVLTATGNGASHSASAIVNVNPIIVNPTCVITSFSASPSSVNSGSSSTLSWNTTGCSYATISNIAGTQAANGSVGTGALYGTTSYTLTAYAAAGASTTASTSVTVNPITTTCSIGSFNASPNTVVSGGSSTLYWTTSGCSSVSVIGPNFSSSNFSGSQSIGPIYGTQTYTINAYGTSGAPTTQTTSVTATTVTPPSGSAPVATTLAALVGTDGVSATLNGYINSNIGSCSYSCGTTTYYFQYGTSQYSLYQQTPTQTTYTNSGNVSAYLPGLQTNTTYYFQLMASNSYGSTSGGVLSFMTNGYGSNSTITALTGVPTNVTAYSARLNGLVTGTTNNYYGYTGASVYFEYGTSPSLGLRTSAQTATISSLSNYFDTISTNANTTYYYRIDAVVNGQTYMGSTVAFSTPGFTNTITTNTNTTTTISKIGTGGGSAFLQLAITDQSQTILPGDSLNYVVTYQNISGLTLSNVVINVILPTGVTFRQSSQGVLTTNNTVAVIVGSLLPTQQGTITISATTDVTIVPGNNFVTTATAAFTLPSSAQDSAVAYVLNTVATQNNLAGLALFGYGFFPTTLLGWILLLGLLLVLILIARYYYHRANAQRLAQVPTVTHVHYDSPAPTASPTMHGYNGDNLPH